MPCFLTHRFGFLAALLIAVAPMAAQAAVALKNALLASGVLIMEAADLRLGDLFDGLPADVATRSLQGYGAWKTGDILTAAQLASIARDNGLSWRPAAEAFELRIERPVERIGEDAIQETIVQALAAQGLPRDQLRFDTPPLPFSVEKGKARQGLRVSNLSFDAKQSRFTAQVSPVAGGETQKISGHAVAMLEVPVLSRPVGIGEVISTDAIVLQRLRADQAGRSYLLEPDRIIGKAAKRGLSAGQPIRPADLNTIMMVQKNGPITVNVVSGAMLLTMQGKALDHGALGDTVRVLNVRSNKVLSGIVAAPATVTVQAAIATIGAVSAVGPTN